MVHIGEHTSSTIISKGISAGRGQNAYRGLVKVLKGAKQARNYSQCDSLLMGDRCGAHTFPYVEVKNPTATIETLVEETRLLASRPRAERFIDNVETLRDDMARLQQRIERLQAAVAPG